MNDQEAAGFAARYKNIWRGGPSVDELRLFMQTLDPGTFGTALIRLTRQVEDPPSIARLWRAYHELDTTANDPTPINCEHCTDGWHTVDYMSNGRTYRGALPCPHCGRQRGTTKTWESCRTASDALHRSLDRHPSSGQA